MRIFTGIIIFLIVLAGAILTILALWNIIPISWSIVWRTAATIAITGVTGAILWLIKTLFLGRISD